MITHLPMIKYRAALEALDPVRLKQQVQHASDIIAAPPGKKHPAISMWRGHVLNLCTYGLIAAEVAEQPDWLPWFTTQQRNLSRTMGPRKATASHRYPAWIGNLWVHRSHRSNLIRKDPDYYDEWPGTPERMPYIWPVPDEFAERGYRLYLTREGMDLLTEGSRELPPELGVDNTGEVLEL